MSTPRDLEPSSTVGLSGAWHVLGLLPLFDLLRKDSAETVSRLASAGVAVKTISRSAPSCFSSCSSPVT